MAQGEGWARAWARASPRETPGPAQTVRVEPLHDLTATQRGLLDDEVEPVSAVMEARQTLTVGP
jgi:hypothetical protein